MGEKAGPGSSTFRPLKIISLGPNYKYSWTKTVRADRAIYDLHTAGLCSTQNMKCNCACLDFSEGAAAHLVID